MTEIRFWKGTRAQLAQTLTSFAGVSLHLPGIRRVEALSPQHLPRSDDELFVLHSRWPRGLVPGQGYDVEPSVLETLERWQRGRLLVYNDIDKPSWWGPELVPVVQRIGGIMFKTQLSRTQPPDTPVRWHPSPYEPWAGSLSLFARAPIPWDEREYDLTFVGDPRTGRRRALMDALARADIPLKTLFRERVPPADYADIMYNTRIALSLPGDGPRCRREWEAARAGALLVFDQRSYSEFEHRPFTVGVDCATAPLCDDVAGSLDALTRLSQRPVAREWADRGLELARVWSTPGACPLWNQILDVTAV